MKRILLKTYNIRISEEKNSLIEATQVLNKLIEAIDLSDITNIEIQKVLQSGINSVADMYLSRMDNTENLTVAGIPINKDKFKELIQINNPELITKLVQEFINNHKITNLADIIISENKAFIRPDLDEFLLEKHSIYADTPKQIEVANSLYKLKDALNSHLDTINSNISLVDYIDNWKINGLIPIGAKVKNTFQSNSRVDIDINFIKKQ